MTAYNNLKQETQDIKKFLKPHTLNKVLDKTKLPEKAPPTQKYLPVGGKI